MSTEATAVKSAPEVTTAPAPATATAVAKIPQTAPVKKVSVIADLACQLSVDPMKLVEILKKTVFAACRTDEEFQTMCIVAREFHLNPMLKQIYAFPAKNGAIMPMVGIDGWLLIINNHPAFDGMELEDGDGFCTCTIYRKDRAHPTKITEYLDEMKRNNDVWRVYPKRMLRHKAIEQCARVAFGLSGIYDQDDIERIPASASPSPFADEAAPSTRTAQEKVKDALGLKTPVTAPVEVAEG